MMNNMQALFQMARYGNNPKQFITNYVKQQSESNPIMRSVYEMINSNNAQGIEMLARNICKEKGVNPDVLIQNIKNQFGA